MLDLDDKLQSRAGTALVILSIGITGSLLTGAVVEFSVAGAQLAVNRKLKKVGQVAEKVESTVTQLKQEPTVSPLKIQGLEAELKEAKAIVESTEREIEQDLEPKISDDKL